MVQKGDGMSSLVTPHSATPTLVSGRSRRSFTVTSLWLGLGYAALSLARPARAESEIPAGSLVQPAALARLLKSADGQAKPLILQVGSRQLFNEAHIPGSFYAGPGSSETGMAALGDRLKGVAHDKAVVLYCGCCPWTKCPNIRAAWAQAQKLGFTHVQALFLAQDYGTDWVDKGYPNASGAAS